MQIKAFCPKFGLSAPGAAEGQVQLWVRSWDAQPRVLGFSPVSHGPPGPVGAWERRVHEENWAQSSPQVREGWVWLGGLAAVGSQAQGKDSAATSSHSPPCSGCSSFSSLPPFPCFVMWVLDGNPGKAASLRVPGACRGAAWWATLSVLGFCGREEGMKC